MPLDMPLDEISANRVIDALVARENALDAQAEYEANPSPETTSLRISAKRKAKRLWDKAKTAYARAKAESA
jgi:hypothetical protein